MAGRKATGRKPRRSGEANGASGLIEALKFVLPAQSKEGQPHHVHSVFYGGFVIASNGMLTIGHPVEEDINACPNTHELLKALQKCGEKLSITQLDLGRLSIKSDRFKALVDCERFEVMPYVGPDVQCAAIDDRIRTGIEVVSVLASENASRTSMACVMLQANTVVGTNGHVLMEYWHGIDLPPNILIPKAAAKAICNVGKKLVGFGYSYSSATFFYEDQSYIKTQLFEEQYVNYGAVLNVPTNPFPLPADFYKALDTVEAFSENTKVYFTETAMRSHEESSNKGATFDIEGLPKGQIYNSEYLQLVRAGFVNVDFQENKAFFFADNVRGAIMGCTG